MVEHELKLEKARESGIQATHKLEEAHKLAEGLREQLEERGKHVTALSQGRDIAKAATKLLQKENLRLKTELADTKSKLAGIQKQAATEENIQNLKRQIENLKVS